MARNRQRGKLFPGGLILLAVVAGVIGGGIISQHRIRADERPIDQEQAEHEVWQSIARLTVPWESRSGRIVLRENPQLWEPVQASYDRLRLAGEADLVDAMHDWWHVITEEVEADERVKGVAELAMQERIRRLPVRVLGAPVITLPSVDLLPPAVRDHLASKKLERNAYRSEWIASARLEELPITIDWPDELRQQGMKRAAELLEDLLQRIPSDHVARTLSARFEGESGLMAEFVMQAVDHYIWQRVRELLSAEPLWAEYAHFASAWEARMERGFRDAAADLRDVWGQLDVRGGDPVDVFLALSWPDTDVQVRIH